MNPSTSFEYIGKGAYSLVEASQLTRIPTLRIRRWLEGNSYRRKGRVRRTPPIIQSVFSRATGELTLSFADLMEVQFLDSFIAKGVSWRVLRIAARRAGEILDHTHPFSTKAFKTDGKSVIAEIEDTEGVRLLNLVPDQFEIEKFVAPMLLAGIEYNEDKEPARWWPLGRKHHVVIDPQRSFGAPIIDKGGVRTSVLAASVKADKSVMFTSRIFRVDVAAVRSAVRYEREIARARRRTA